LNNSIQAQIAQALKPPSRGRNAATAPDAGSLPIVADDHDAWLEEFWRKWLKPKSFLKSVVPDAL